MYQLFNVSKVYAKSTALLDLNFTIAKGVIFGFIGLSGAGKSTLLRTLAGLIQPSSGSIFFQGKDLSELSEQELRAFRQSIGMIFQQVNLFNARTVAENIAYPLEIAGIPNTAQQQRIAELLQIVGLSAKKDAYPATLSGGEKQRVGIARALANRPEVLLCDEATSALDPKTKRDILELLQMVNQQLGVTVILITHDMDVIQAICHEVAVLEAGQIIERGSVKQLLEQPEHETTKQFLNKRSFNYV